MILRTSFEGRREDGDMRIVSGGPDNRAVLEIGKY